MGRALLSAFLLELLAKVATPEAAKFLKRRNYVDRLMEALQIFASLVDDAEEKQFRNSSIREWLNELQDTVYLLEELLDEIIFQSIDVAQNIKWVRIRRFLPTKNQHAKIQLDIRHIIGKVENLLKTKDSLGLIERVTQKETTDESVPKSASCSSFSSSFEDHVYGREEETRKILDFLRSDNATTGGNTSVIGIVGVGGIGKTTFAQLLYNNYRVKLTFGVRAWVNLSDWFSASSLAEKIIKAFTAVSAQGDNLDLLKTDLKKYLWGKKFLLVLDDCWVLDEADWNLLRTSFEAAARGSVIIVTTRLEKVVKVMHAAHVVHLPPLSLEQCRSLFAAHAFGHDTIPSDSQLEAVGEEIVKKCRGLPLAAKMLGVLLHAKQDLDEWRMILMSELWEGDSNLCLPFLRLCYLDLPSYLEQCFTFLSVFPKGYGFRKKEVVLLWMAQGFLQQSNLSDIGMEDVGVEYFDFLLARSFIQKSHNDPGAGFLMHYMVHDLASFSAGNVHLHLERNDEKFLNFQLVHHLSFGQSIKDFSENIWELHKPLSLRTCSALYSSIGPRFQLSTKAMLYMVSNSGYLRVFSLSGCDIVKLPSSIGKLRHLHYLNLSFTRIRTLPESICDLCNLHTLKLSFCHYLTNLPAKMMDLISLRHLDIKCSGIQGMPLLMGRLTSLRTLTDFIVGKLELRMKELAGLSKLQTLVISKLQNVVDARDASGANLKGKKYLDDLSLQWTTTHNHPQNHREVLENLEPPGELKSLTIFSYCGTRFPDWLGDASFLNLVFLRLLDCRCLSLPPLGQLPSLKDLFIEGFDKVSYVGQEFYGRTTSHGPFKSLQTLQFYGMLKWKDWVPLNVEGSDFPCLHKLYVQNCPKLVRDLPKHLPSLEKLEISGCSDLVALLPRMPNNCEVVVSNCNDYLMRSLLKVASQASLLGAATVEATCEASPKLSSNMTNMPSDFTISVSEIEEIVDEHDDQMRTTSPRDDLQFPFPSGSPKVLGFPQFGELSTRMHSPRVKEYGVSETIADIPNIRHDVEPQTSLVDAGVPTSIDEAAQPVSETLNVIDHAKDQIETWSSQDPYDRHSSFEILQMLDLSQLKRLPCELRSLRIEGCKFLESLPDELILKIPTLQELYVIDCCSLKSFTRDGYPTSLRILYIRNCRKLEFLPLLETKQKYEFLEQLCIGSSCDSLISFTLNFFPKLRILCIWDCPSLVSFSISEGFSEHLIALKSLEIMDCPNLMSFPTSGLPTPNLASIRFSNCSSLSKLPNFMNSLSCLQSLFLHRCPEIEPFPVGGLPSSLIVLSISLCDKLTPEKKWDLHNLDTLSYFEIEGGCIGLEAFPETGLLPSSLNSLCIRSLSNLKLLNCEGLQGLNALETLEINCCSKLRSLPKEGLPPSLVFLCIKECPLLTPKLLNKAGRDWPKIAHIPNIQIDDSIIS